MLLNLFLGYHKVKPRGRCCMTSHIWTVNNIKGKGSVTSGNRQIHTQCQLQYLHPPQISTSINRQIHTNCQLQYLHPPQISTSINRQIHTQCQLQYLHPPQISTSINRQIHTNCQLQYLHPPQISTSGKCHCVIIHQTTKATEYIG